MTLLILQYSDFSVILGDASMSDCSQLESVLGKLGSWLLWLWTLGLHVHVFALELGMCSC